MSVLRADLNRLYDAYHARYGPLNRFTSRPSGRTDPETGEPKMSRIRPPQGGFRLDPYTPVVYALEQFDSAQQIATKATIFHQRVVAPRTPPTSAASPADALAICLDQHAEVVLPEIARLLGCPDDQAREQLGTLVYDDPASGRLVAAAEYLSGQVREKLERAEAASADDPAFEINVQALRG